MPVLGTGPTEPTGPTAALDDRFWPKKTTRQKIPGTKLTNSTEFPKVISRNMCVIPSLGMRCAKYLAEGTPSVTRSRVDYAPNKSCVIPSFLCLLHTHRDQWVKHRYFGCVQHLGIPEKPFVSVWKLVGIWDAAWRTEPMSRHNTRWTWVKSNGIRPQFPWYLWFTGYRWRPRFGISGRV